MNVNEHERLSNVTLPHKLKWRNSYLHFTVNVGFSVMSITHALILCVLSLSITFICFMWNTLDVEHR